VNLENKALSEDLLRGFRALLLSSSSFDACALYMMLDEVSLFQLWCKCNSSSLFLDSPFQGIPYEGDHHHTTNEGVALSWLRRDRSFCDCSTHKVSLSSV
jgi:hypothetical protein